VLIRAIFLFNACVALATLLGVVFLFLRRNPYAIPLSLVPLLFPLIYYATHTNLRYRHPIDPILLLISAIAIASSIRRDAPVVAATF